MTCYGSNDYCVWGSRLQEVRGRNSPEPTVDTTEPTSKEAGGIRYGRSVRE